MGVDNKRVFLEMLSLAHTCIKYWHYIQPRLLFLSLNGYKHFCRFKSLKGQPATKITPSVNPLVSTIFESGKTTLSIPEMKTAESANSLDLDEVAHNEPPHLDLQCLPSSL